MSSSDDISISAKPPESEPDLQIFRAGGPAVHCSEKLISSTD